MLAEEKVGLRVRDVLEEIDGRQVSGLKQEELDGLIKKRPLKLCFRRDEKVGIGAAPLSLLRPDPLQVEAR